MPSLNMPVICSMVEFCKHIAHLPENGRTSNERADKEEVIIQSIHTAKGEEWPVVFILGCSGGSLPRSRGAYDAEERRLFYVAVTRAKEELYIFYDADSGLSPFLVESKYACLPCVLLE